MLLLNEISTIAVSGRWTWTGYNNLLKPLLPNLQARWRAAGVLLESQSLLTSALMDFAEAADRQPIQQGYSPARQRTASGMLANILTDILVMVYEVVLAEGGGLPPPATGLNLGVPAHTCADTFWFPLVRVPIPVPQRVKDATAVRQAACGCFQAMVAQRLPAELVDNICKRVMVLHFL